ncbi:MAG: TauD/TfdA family dioxygenase [Novosphingobium sp.]
MSIRIEPVKEHIGGIVHVDKAHLCDDGVIAACREALEDRGVLVFPRIALTDKEQLAFTDLFGKRVNFTKTVPGGDKADEADVYKITLDKKSNLEPEYVLGTWFWHIDGVTIDQPLPKTTFLSARKLSDSGGQTEFASTFAAYEALPAEMKEQIDELKVIHRMVASMRPVFRDLTEAQKAKYNGMATDMVHPLVWTQASGRKSLVLGSHADEIIGMRVSDSRALITRLMEFASQPQFTYRHEWQLGDFVAWNNCGVMHRVVPYADDTGRSMHRTTVTGDQRLGRSLKEFESA